MSIRNQPYLPLYVQDFLTDEKLAECSAKATGVYIRLMCLMHKSDEYGKILLKQKDKVCFSKTDSKDENSATADDKIEWFANKITKHFPYDFYTVKESLIELINENVLLIDGDYLVQKRMVKDAELSETRSKSGKKGGEATAEHFAKANGQAKPKAKAKAKRQANAEIESEYKDVLKHPFSEVFNAQWERWKAYKKAQHNFTYKFFDTEQTALNGLVEKSGKNEQVAIATINHTIANGWKGFVIPEQPQPKTPVIPVQSTNPLSTLKRIS